MSGSKDNCIGRKRIAILSVYRCYCIVADNEIGYFFFKMNFAATFQYLHAHRCYDMWEFIGANMWMSFIQYFFFGSKMDKKV